MSSKVITVVKTFAVSDVYKPVPASKLLPEWYKKTDSYIYSNTFDVNILNVFDNNETIKKCIPVFDALTSGYIIPMYADLWVKKINGVTTYTLSNNEKVDVHHLSQAPYHPLANPTLYPKFINPWGIKTPPGYSCLFTAPFHRTNEFFTVLDGVVDTDRYQQPVNFPFVLNDPNFEGVIPAGTPMVQVLPFKRESWEINFSSNKEELERSSQLLSSKLYNKYKTLFWSKKEYK
jgi:hypothetical protein